MTKRIFVSYSHAQKDWVWEKLVPCLRAAGADVCLDSGRREARIGAFGCMDAEQDSAGLNLLVLSPEYLAGPDCMHEMQRAFSRDPDLSNGSILIVHRVECDLPRRIDGSKPFYFDLRDDGDAAAWDRLLDACGVELGTPAPDWFAARDGLVASLAHGRSAHLVVRGEPRWRQMVGRVRTILEKKHGKRLGIVDLSDPATISRQGFVAHLLRACGSLHSAPQAPDDLGVLSDVLCAQSNAVIAILDFDLALQRDYGYDLYVLLRTHVVEFRSLSVLILTREECGAEFSPNHPLMSLDMTTIPLSGCKPGESASLTRERALSRV